jgi:hypothetical protein
VKLYSLFRRYSEFKGCPLHFSQTVSLGPLFQEADFESLACPVELKVKIRALLDIYFIINHPLAREWNSPLGKISRRWEERDKMNFKEIDCDNVELIEQIQGRIQWRTIVNTLRNFWIPIIEEIYRKIE